jgi:ABC-type Fe3+/spermidine/putrescine transport system ATPase subunit
MEPVVEFRHVSKIFGVNQVINDISLRIPEKSFVTFLGPSGCGKTTLLRMVAGFYEPDAGEVLIRGAVVNTQPAYRRNTAMVFQEYALFPHMSVFETSPTDCGRGATARRRSGARSARRSGSCNSTVWAIATPTSSPEASSNGWRWRGRW